MRKNACCPEPALSSAYGCENRYRCGVANRRGQAIREATVLAVDEYIDVRAKNAFLGHYAVEYAGISRLQCAEGGADGIARLFVRIDGDDGAPA